MNKGGAIKVYGLVLILVLSMLVTVIPPGMFNDGFQISETSSASVSGYKAANGFWEQRLDYDWSISKTVSEEYLAVPIGDSAVLQYSLAVEKEHTGTTDVWGVFGGIYVINSGSSATVGLSITDTVLYSLNGGASYSEIVSESVVTSDKPVLQADSDFFNYPYLINFEPIAGAIYKNRATVTIDNGDGYVAEQNFSLPEAPLMLSMSDGTATVTDLFEVPAGWSISVSDEGPWEMQESGIITFDVTVTNDIAAPGTTAELNNYAKVTELDTGAESTDQATVILESIGRASINVTKTGPLCAWEGKTVTYTITVLNDGEVDLYAVSVIDQTIDFYANLTFLAMGASYTWEVEFVIPQLTPCDDYFCNQVTAVGWHKINCHPTYQVIDHDYWCVKIWHPGMEIEKTADSEMLMEGQAITYSYTVTNTGDSPLNDVRVFDDQLGWFYLDDYQADGTLASGESWSFSVVSSIPVTGETDRWCYCNIATAYGDICDGTWEDSAEWCVEIVRPEISVTKWSPYTMLTAGQTMIPFYINVTNSGNIDLTEVYIDDSLMGTFYKTDEVNDDGVLAVGETWELVLWYELGEDNGQHWTLCNDVTAWGYVLDIWVSDEAEWCIDIVHPSIDIVKTVNYDMMVEGHDLTYTISVTNTGDVALENVRVFDNMLGWFYLEGDGILAAGASWVFTYDYTVPLTDIDEQYQICNEATAYGDIMSATVSDMDYVCVTIVHPSIDIVKTVDSVCDVFVEGQTVTYTINVTNTGDVALENVRVFDNMLGWFYLSGNGILAAGASWEFTYDATIPVTDANEQYQICNEATAYGDICHATVSDMDSVCLTIVHPSIDIEKTADTDEAIEGQTVAFTLTVTNDGDVELSNVRVNDSLAGWFYLGGDGILSPGEVWIINYDYVIPVTELQGQYMIYNLATAYGTVCDGDVTDVDDFDLIGISIVHPCIDIVKTGDLQVAMEGQTVTYTVTVTNCGDVALTNVRVHDSLAGWFHLGGDGILAPGASWTFSYEYTIPDADPCLAEIWKIANCATAIGNYGDLEIADGVCYCVKVIHPMIALDKSISCNAAEPGDTVSYQFTVTNTGDVELMNIVVNDAKIGMVFNLPESLAPGASYSFSWDFAIPMNIMDDPLCNQAIVTGFTDYFPNMPVTDSDCAVLDIMHPGLSVLKFGPDYARVGDVVVFSIWVQNVGDVPLYDVMLYDEGLEWSLGDLAIGEQKVEYAAISITADMSDPFHNVATATAEYWSCVAQDDRMIDASGSKWVDIVDPSLDLQKIGPETIVLGECGEHPCIIEYTFIITNDGDVALNGVVLVDEMLGLRIFIGDLGVGQSVTRTGCFAPGDDCECPPSGCLVNTASVTGFYLEMTAFDESTWSSCIDIGEGPEDPEVPDDPCDPCN